VQANIRESSFRVLPLAPFCFTAVESVMVQTQHLSKKIMRSAHNYVFVQNDYQAGKTVPRRVHGLRINKHLSAVE
jgi:hypothetical protein